MIFKSLIRLGACICFGQRGQGEGVEGVIQLIIGGARNFIEPEQNFYRKTLLPSYKERWS